MFYECSKFTSLNLSNFNNVTNMSYMFLLINKGCNLTGNDKKILKEFS